MSISNTAANVVRFTQLLTTGKVNLSLITTDTIVRHVDGRIALVINYCEQYPMFDLDKNGRECIYVTGHYPEGHEYYNPKRAQTFADYWTADEFEVIQLKAVA